VLVARFMSWCKNAAQQGIGAGERRSGARGSMPKTLGRSMTRRAEKQLRQLDAMEEEFRLELVGHLRACAAGIGTLLFLVSSMRPESWPPSVRSHVADRLFDAALEILALRAQHGLDGEPCLAAGYRDACLRHVDLADHHRPGPRQQAQQLLQQIGEERVE
jgi:hypothetical protein